MKKRILTIILCFTLLLSTYNVYGVEQSGTVEFSANMIKLNETNEIFTMNIIVDSQVAYSGVEIALDLGTDIEVVSKEFPIKEATDIPVTTGSKLKNGLINLVVFTTDNVFTGKQTVCTLNLKYTGTTEATMSIASAKLAHFDIEETAIGMELVLGNAAVVSLIEGTPITGGGTVTPGNTDTSDNNGATNDNLIAVDDVIPEGLFIVNFKDLHLASWATIYINYIASRGIVSGTGPDTFEPNGTLTREAYIKMLVESFNLVDKSAKSSFTDVDKDAWHYIYIASAEKAGITEGIGNNTFGVSMTITREQMATMTLRALKAVDKQLIKDLEKVEFADNDTIAQYAKESVYEMQMSGILSGVGDNYFAPKDTATRAQAAKVIYMLITK